METKKTEKKKGRKYDKEWMKRWRTKGDAEKALRRIVAYTVVKQYYQAEGWIHLLRNTILKDEIPRLLDLLKTDPDALIDDCIQKLKVFTGQRKLRILSELKVDIPQDIKNELGMPEDDKEDGG